MRNVYFPTTVVDGFFNDPDSIRRIGLEQEYADNNGTYPGHRSRRNLKEINEMLYETIMLKFLDLFFPRDQISGISGHGAFQLVSAKYGSGWVHRDNSSIASGIIYLTPNDQGESIGTSLYEKVNALDDPINHRTQITENRFVNPSKYDAARKAHNSKFKEVMSVAGLYNRLFVFDSHFYHAAQNFVGETDQESRMTIVFFIQGVRCDGYPMQRIHNGAVTIL